MISGAFDLWWSSRFGTNLPLAPVLREAFPERWVRFHVAPESTRCPATEAEYRAVVRRAEMLAVDVLSEGGPCWLVAPTFDAATEDVHDVPEAPGVRLHRVMAGTLDGADVTIWAARVAWRSGAFELALRAMAADRLVALWASQATGEVLAPCADGVDVVVASPERRAALATKYRPWLARAAPRP